MLSETEGRGNGIVMPGHSNAAGILLVRKGPRGALTFSRNQSERLFCKKNDLLSCAKAPKFSAGFAANFVASPTESERGGLFCHGQKIMGGGPDRMERR